MNETSRVDFSRRSFLKATAAGAAAFSASGALAAGASPADSDSPGEDAMLRWGVIGTGNRGMWTHVRVLKSALQSRIVALCDIAPERLATAVANAGRPVAAYSDYEKLLANPDVNAVVIATPNLMHDEMLRAALQAGKHVLCEKPAGVTPPQASEMQRIAESAKTVVMFGMQYRNNRKQQQIHELLTSGRIGKPRYLVQNCSRGDWNLSPNIWQYADPRLGGKPMNWRFSHTATGGTLNEFSCHYFDLLNWMTGALPQRISCEGGISVYHDGRDTWDHAVVTFEYPDDVVAVHTLCLFGPNRADLQIMGDEGTIESVGDLLRVANPARKGPHKTPARSQEIKIESSRPRSSDDAVLALYEDFAECVKSGKKPDASPARAAAASRACWLAELSAQRGSPVKWEELS